jgi:alpha-L-fucosidase
VMQASEPSSACRQHLRHVLYGPVNPSSPETVMQSLEQELLDIAKSWKSTAVEFIQKSESGSHSQMANEMLYACAEMLVWKIAHHEVESRAATPAPSLPSQCPA